jgi:alkyl hydroperoxide reductase subunit F
MHDLIIIGGGPAGAAAAIYAARKRLHTVFLTQEWGGQSAVSSEIQNWIGTPKIMGADLADALKKHVEMYKDEVLEIISPAEATGLTVADDHVEVTTKKGTFQAKTVLIASGATRRKLEVPGAEAFDQKGLTYCASCDGPLFADKDVVVIGGGNAAFETALQLLAYCKTVTLLNRTEIFRADEITVAAALAHHNMVVIKNAVPTEVLGEKFVTGIKYKNTQTNEETLLPVEGVFVEIGLLPNSQWIGDVIQKNAVGQIVTDPKTQRTSAPRVWAAGDVSDGLYHQNNIAAGDAVKALEDIYMFVHRGS